jgi:hypothetical protein
MIKKIIKIQEIKISHLGTFKQIEHSSSSGKLRERHSKHVFLPVAVKPT